MEPKDAFMAGVCATLAEANVTPSELVNAAMKLAGEEKPEQSGKPGKGPGAASLLPGVGLLGKGLLWGAGTATLGAGALGHAGGRLGHEMMSSDLPTTKDVRKEYLIKKLEDLIRERKARLNNDLIRRAL